MSPRVLLENLAHRARVANIDVVMLIVGNRLHELIARLAGRGFRAEKTTAHVVVDPDDALPILREMLDRLRADQPGGASDNNVFGFIRFEFVLPIKPAAPIIQVISPVALLHPRRGILLISRQHLLDQILMFVPVDQKADVPRVVDQRIA